MWSRTEGHSASPNWHASQHQETGTVLSTSHQERQQDRSEEAESQANQPSIPTFPSKLYEDGSSKRSLSCWRKKADQIKDLIINNGLYIYMPSHRDLVQDTEQCCGDCYSLWIRHQTHTTGHVHVVVAVQWSTATPYQHPSVGHVRMTPWRAWSACLGVVHSAYVWSSSTGLNRTKYLQTGQLSWRNFMICWMTWLCLRVDFWWLVIFENLPLVHQQSKSWISSPPPITHNMWRSPRSRAGGGAQPGPDYHQIWRIGCVGH